MRSSSASSISSEGIRPSLSFASLVQSHEGSSQITRDIPIRMKRRGVEMRLVIEENHPVRIDPILIKAIARAHCWYGDFISGRVATPVEIASRHGLDKGYVSRVINLAFLAPDIVEDIVSGRQPADFTIHKLLRRTQLPINWEEQKRVLGYR